MKDQINSAQLVLPCLDLDRSLDFYISNLGFRLEMISPADSPTAAVISGYDITIRLEESGQIGQPSLRVRSARIRPHELFSPDGLRIDFTPEEEPIEIFVGTQEFILTVPNAENAWKTGRAGMQYRDLIPGRLGGRFIASHIRIPTGGPVPDYVHYHKIRFQLIFCLAGWARLVYEDQGNPFKMRAGECVLQPPEIRHRVLECSDNFEVVEIGCPAVHETFADHDLPLPNKTNAPARIFGGQQFVRHESADAAWKRGEIGELLLSRTDIKRATGGLADVCVVKAASDQNFVYRHPGEFCFFYVIEGIGQLAVDKSGSTELAPGCGLTMPANVEFQIQAKTGLKLLWVRL